MRYYFQTAGEKCGHLIQYIHLNTKRGETEVGRRREGEGENEERGKEMSWKTLRNFTIYDPPYWFTKKRQITEGGVENAMVSQKDNGISNRLRIEKIL